VYCKHELVTQAFVHGDSLQASLVAIIVPDEVILMKWAKENELGNKSFEELCKDEKVKNHILQALIKYGREDGLKGFENIKNISLTHELFSAQNDLLTPTFKLKRNQAKIKFQNQIDSMYAELSQ